MIFKGTDGNIRQVGFCKKKRLFLLSVVFYSAYLIKMNMVLKELLIRKGAASAALLLRARLKISSVEVFQGGSAGSRAG